MEDRWRGEGSGRRKTTRQQKKERKRSERERMKPRRRESVLLCGVGVPFSPALWSPDRSPGWTCPVSERGGRGTPWRPPRSSGSRGAAGWARPGSGPPRRAWRCTGCCSSAPGRCKRFRQTGWGPTPEPGSRIPAGPACPGSWPPATHNTMLLVNRCRIYNTGDVLSSGLSLYLTTFIRKQSQFNTGASLRPT